MDRSRFKNVVVLGIVALAASFFHNRPTACVGAAHHAPVPARARFTPAELIGQIQQPHTFVQRSNIIRLLVAGSSFSTGGTPAAAMTRRDLFSLILPTLRGTNATDEELKAIDASADELARSIPLAQNARDLLSGTWRLVFTTEPDSLQAMGSSDKKIYKTINLEQGTTENSFPLLNGKRFNVSASISTGAGFQDANAEFPAGLRTLQTFLNARWVSGDIVIPAPPVGQVLELPFSMPAWFVTIYLDERVLVTRSSRGNLGVWLRQGAAGDLPE